MRDLVDANLLLRIAQPSHPLHFVSAEAVARLSEQNHEVLFCPQNIAEFWNVATRPIGSNGLGLQVQDVLKEIASIEGSLTLLPDVPAIYIIWKRLVDENRVLGVKVYDARLVAVMNVYGVENILSFNADDFKRYRGINVILPPWLVS